MVVVYKACDNGINNLKKRKELKKTQPISGIREEQIRNKTTAAIKSLKYSPKNFF